MVKSRRKLIWNIPRLLKTSWALLTNPHVAGKNKLFLALASIGYILWPLDFLPDIIPLLGQADEIGVLFLLLNWFVNSASGEDIEAEYYVKENGRNSDGKDK